LLWVISYVCVFLFFFFDLFFFFVFLLCVVFISLFGVFFLFVLAVLLVIILVLGDTPHHTQSPSCVLVCCFFCFVLLCALIFERMIGGILPRSAGDGLAMSFRKKLVLIFAPPFSQSWR